MPFFQALIREIHKIKEIRLNRNIVSYLICVVIASILWFFNALNKDYSTEISYPVKYTNFPDNKYTLVKLPSQLQLEVKAKGFALLGYRIKTSFLPITFNVSAYIPHFQQKNDLFEYTLNTNDIKDKISNQLSSDIKLVNIFPEEILFRFASAKHKKIAVKPVIDYTLKRQYILNRVSVVPDSIIVSGPASVIDTLQYIPTTLLTLKDLGKDVKRTLELSPVPDCSFKNESVEIYIEVEQFTEAKKTFPITALQVPDSMNIRLFPATVNLSYEIGLSKYEKVTDNAFIFAVEYPKSNTNFLEVKVLKAPAFIKNLTFTPQKVEYILEKK